MDPHESESLRILLRHLGQIGRTLVLMALVIVTSLLTLNPVRAPIHPNYHLPIEIDGNGGFTQQNGVMTGNGTESDPYVIGGWWIIAPPGITIRNTDSYFVIRSVHSTSGINMTNVSNGKIEHSLVLFPGYYSRAILTLDSSKNIIISQDQVDQIIINSSSDLTISESTGGITVNSSRNIVIFRNSGQIDINSSSDFTISESTGPQTISSSYNGTLAGNILYTWYSTLYGPYSINIVRSSRLAVENNTLTQGITIRGNSPEQFDSNVITPDNTVNGRPLLFYKNCGDLDVDSSKVGELIVANCNRVSVANLNPGSLNSGNPYPRVLEMAFVSDAVVKNVTGNIFVTNSDRLEASSNTGGFEVDSSVDVKIFNNKGAIEVDLSTDVQISDSVAWVNISSSTNVSLSNSGLTTDARNHFTARVSDSNNVSISGSAFCYGDCTGLSVYRSSHVTVSANRFNGERGLEIENSAFVEISDNLIDGSLTGAIVLNWCSEVSIHANRIPAYGDYYDDGVVRISDCDDVAISGNSFVAPTLFWDWGPPRISNFLKISLSSNVAVAGNTFVNSTNAIYIADSSGVTINDNNVESNIRGVVLNDTSNVRVFHNNFVNNTVQASDTYSTQNAWDNGYPSGGNFLSDYTGIDNCSGPQQNICPSPDGIGDTPYAFNDNQDRDPLIKPFAPLVSVTAKYNPGVISLTSLSRYLTVSIKLPLGLNASNIVLSSIRLNSTIALAARTPATVVNQNGPQVLIVKFNVNEVKTLFAEPGNYSLYLTGNIVGSVAFRPFAASTTIRVQSG